jgi:adenosylhomocysteine nucleosidase
VPHNRATSAGNLKKTVAIVAALKSEVRSLVRTWPARRIEHEGRKFTFYEGESAVLVCGGIGQESAHGAAEALIAHHSPDLVVSAGIAGALVRELQVGDTIFPASIIDTGDGSRHPTSIGGAAVGTTSFGRTILASSARMAGRREKQQLRTCYGAHAVDMESAGVARAAERHGLPFLAVKAISDEVDFELPELEDFISRGRLETARFLLHFALRPWHWLKVFRLARNARRASENLCAWLRESAMRNTIVPSALAHPNPDGHST